jgi:hypothetical protein
LKTATVDRTKKVLIVEIAQNATVFEYFWESKICINNKHSNSSLADMKKFKKMSEYRHCSIGSHMSKFTENFKCKGYNL